MNIRGGTDRIILEHHIVCHGKIYLSQLTGHAIAMLGTTLVIEPLMKTLLVCG